MLFYILAYVIVLSLTLLLYWYPLPDFSQDLGRHILLGKIIFQTHTVPSTNLLSYTYPSFPFINHHWFSEVIFYLLFQVVGIFGLFWFMIFFIICAILLLFHFCIKKYGIFTSLICTIFYVSILSSRAYLRPEIFSYFFVAIFLVLLYQNREKPTKWIFLLPALQLFWTNMHINFPVGWILVGIFFIESSINIKLNNNISKTKNSVLQLGIVLILCFVSTLINPHGIIGAIYPFTVFSNYGYSIAENQSFFTLLSLHVIFPWMWTLSAEIIVLFSFALIFYKRVSIADWLLIGIFSIGALTAVRNTGLFVLTTIIPFTMLFSSFISFLIKKSNYHQNLVLGKICLIIIECIVCVWFIISMNGFGLQIQSEAKNGADFLLTHHLYGPIFNNFDIGSYLDYRLYPNTKVFVDGRPEAYPASFFQQIYIPMQENPTLFDKESAKYHFNVIFFAYTDQTPWANQFIHAILQNKEWKLVYLDSAVMILIRDNNSNRHLIQQLSMDEKTVVPIEEQNYSLKQLLQLATFFQSAGWIDDEINTLQKSLNKNPEDCQIIAVLTQLYGSENDTIMANIFSQKYQALCQ